MIGIVGTPLNQWDVGRSVTVAGITADRVHFANKGDSKAVIMELVDGQAKIPDYLLQSGKQICAYVVANGVTVESKSFYVIQRERPENYVYKDDQRNYIYELIADAQTATEAAKQATKAANEAADKANQAAKSWVIMGEVKGESVVIDDAIDQTFAGFRIFGKTTQDGVPTPDAPVDLVSVENPTVEVNERSMLVPYTLRGIPVASGGNYTDANGQQWICDEVDFDRGVYIHRVHKVSALDLSGGGYGEVGSYARTALWIADEKYSGAATANGLCNIMPMYGNYTADQLHFYVQNRQAWVFVPIDELEEKTAEGIRTWLNNKGAEFLYIIANPTETPLSEEELSAYAALHTSRYGTTVTNDQDAYMDVHYQMDAKKYIDSVVGTGSTGILNATVE